MKISPSKALPRLLVALTLTTALTVAALADPIPPPSPPFPPSFTGPTSRYYLDNGDTIYVVQGNSVVQSFSTAYGRGFSEDVLAVTQTIQTRAGDLRSGDLGAGEYTLSGQPIAGSGYFSPPTFGLITHDGTSDGHSNYFGDHDFAGVYQTGPDWTNPVVLPWS